MKRNALTTSISAIIAASAIVAAAGTEAHPGGRFALSPDAKGKSILALNTAGTGEAELIIYGPIGDYYWSDGITASSIVAQLAQITAPTINVRINSDGGVVSDGLAIYNALKRHGATINVTIDGIAASIASLIAMSGKTVRMPENTLMMLHAPMGNVMGNAAELREVADILDTMARSMTTSYAAKSNKADEITALLADGKDHWFTAAEAVAFGLADELVADEEKQNADQVAAAALLSYITAIDASQGAVFAALRNRIQTTTTPSAFASLREAHQRAVYAQLEESTMKHECHLILAQAGGAASATAPATPAVPAAPAVAAANPPAAVVAGEPAPAVASASASDFIAALNTRNESIRGIFAGFLDISGMRELETECLANPRLSIESVQAKLIAKMGGNAEPLAVTASSSAAGRGGAGTVVAGTDQVDKLRTAGAQIILARAGMLNADEDRSARQGNPFANLSLIAMAEQSLIRAGVRTREMTRDEICDRALASGGQSTSDFPIILENALHKMVLRGYAQTPFTWSRFCSVGSLADYRPHNRYHLSSFSDLLETNQAGEYENGVLGDATKETITGKRKGRILQITPEVLVNDDVGAFARIAVALGQAAGRTIEKDVYALFALNAGAGPTMYDGKALFHTDHANIAGTAAKPTVAAFDAARQLLGSQKDPGGNDFLDIVPAVWVGGLANGTQARTTNTAEYDQDGSSKFAPPNTSRGMMRDVVDTARLTGNAWYVFADQNIEPVFEVAFLNGVQTPMITQETNFRTDGLSWKVTHKYGVGAVGWRGAVKNAGT